MGDLDKNDHGSVTKVVADCLPHVNSGLLYKKREELIPVLLVTIRHHEDAKVRNTLTKLLFTLIKDPNVVQRKMIMEGCTSLASIIGLDKTNEELLPHCWENIEDEKEGRRILVADSCSALAPYVRPELRSSLMFSILQQLISDSSPDVRIAVSKNLAVLLTYFEDGDKWNYVKDVFTTLAFDSDKSVSSFFQIFTLLLF